MWWMFKALTRQLMIKAGMGDKRSRRMATCRSNAVSGPLRSARHGAVATYRDSTCRRINIGTPQHAPGERVTVVNYSLKMAQMRSILAAAVRLPLCERRDRMTDHTPMRRARRALRTSVIITR